MSSDIIQIINLVLSIGLVLAVYILVKNSSRSASAVEEIAKELRKISENK